MNKALINWWQGGGASYNSNYQSILDYATAQGYSAPSAAAKTNQSTLMDAMVSSGLYAKADSILVLTGDGADNFKLIDWVTKTKRATANGTITFTNNLGVKSNGTTGYINLGYNSTARVGSQNNAAFYCHVTTKTGTANRTAFGQQTVAASYNFLRNRTGADVMVTSVSCGLSASLANVGNTGRFLLSRSVNTEYKVYKDGALAHTVVTASNAATTVANMPLLALESSLTGTPTISSYFDDNVAIYINGQALDSELAAFDAAYATYFATL